MDPVRFFYSTDGTDAHGPVTKEALLVLYHNGVIGPGSHLCREGESEWRPVNPDDFQIAPARPKPYEPPPFVPTLETLALMKGEPEPWEQRSSIPKYVKIAQLMLGAAAAVSIVHIGMPLIPSDQHAWYVYIFAPIVVFLVLYGVPSLFTLVSRGPIAYTLRLTGTVLLSALALWAVSTGAALQEQQAKEMAAKAKDDASKPIARNTGDTASLPPIEKTLPKLEDQAVGDSPTAKAARDMMTVTSQFVDKVKASNEAEAASNFEVLTIESTDDLAHRRELLTKLRAAQLEVLTYLQRFDSHCMDAMAHNNFTPDFVAEVLAGARKTGHVDALIALWQSKIKLTDDYVARLDYLGKSYGSWNVNDGKVVFADNDAMVAYNGYVQALQNDVKAIKDQQSQLVQ